MSSGCTCNTRAHLRRRRKTRTRCPREQRSGNRRRDHRTARVPGRGRRLRHQGERRPGSRPRRVRRSGARRRRCSRPTRRVAAPVVVSKRQLAASAGRVSAIVVNSGCANACTGPDGMTDAVRMTELTAAALGIDPSAVLVASTGVIGVRLDMREGRARHHRGGGGTRRGRRRRCRARDHDDRSVPEGSGGRNRSRRTARSGSAASPRAPE